MRIGTVQFDAKLGQILFNISTVERILSQYEPNSSPESFDLLVLPELAFAGYNHPSLSAIAPFLESTADGPSTRWAQRTAKRFKCTVVVGYAEVSERGNDTTAHDSKIQVSSDTVAYNSMVMVDSQGKVVGHYRKSFLYYTDETWAHEGSGFYAGILPIGDKSEKIQVAAGICMDINPYKFQSPWTAYEFAHHACNAKAKVIVLSMAWLTRLDQDEMWDSETPDWDTLAYWIQRLAPLTDDLGPGEEVIVVCANRTGEDGIAPLIGDVRYAGSSCVMGMRRKGHLRMWKAMGRASAGLLDVNTNENPRFLAVSSSEVAEPVAQGQPPGL